MLIGRHAWQMVAVDDLTQRVTLKCRRCGANRERQTSDADRVHRQGEDPLGNQFRNSRPGGDKSGL